MECVGERQANGHTVSVERNIVETDVEKPKTGKQEALPKSVARRGTLQRRKAARQ